MACFATLLATGGYAVFYIAKKGVFDRIDEKLRIDAYSIMSATYLKDDESVELHFTVSLLREYSGDVRTAYYQIRDREDETVKRSGSLKTRDLPPSRATSRKAVFWNLNLPDGRKGRAIDIRYGPSKRERVREQPGTGDSLSIVVVKDIEDELLSLSTLRMGLLSVAGSIVLLTPILVFLVIRKGLFPLESLARKTESIDSESLNKRFPVDSLPGELKPIATQLNQLLDRLYISFQRERTFSSDVAHELRTPIAELKNIAEVGLKWKDPSLADDYKNALEIADQMERIVNQLFELMRCESDQIKVSLQPLSLSEVLATIAAPLEPIAKSKDIELELAIQENTNIESDRYLLERIIGNLLVNAVAYTPDKGQITISFLPDQNGCILITNTIHDLAPEDLEKVFDRFWRKDKSRSDENHSGIGLSIARAFAKQLGLELEAKLEGADKVVFTLSGLSPT